MAQQFSFIFAIPIPGPSLDIHRFIFERIEPLGDTSGLAVWWRIISHPAHADPIYLSLRTPELVQRDEVDTRMYIEFCNRYGGEARYQMSEYHKLADRYNIREDQRPAVVFRTEPDCGETAILNLSPTIFESNENAQKLACFLYEELGERRVRQFAEAGQYTENSMKKLQGHLDEISKLVNNSIARGGKMAERLWRSYLRREGLIETPDPGISTIGKARIKGGTLILETETEGKQDGEAVFAPWEGEPTLQMRLMWRLLQAWPKGISFLDIARELYGDELRAALDNGEKSPVEIVARRVRALVRNVREDRLEKVGINPDVLPSIRKSSSQHDAVRLRFASLDNRVLGHIPPPRF